MIIRVLWTSVAATLVVAVAFSAAIRFIVRSGELRSDGRRRTAAGYSALATLALAAFGAAVVYGLILMAHKS
jgi:hypothetical protein